MPLNSLPSVAGRSYLAPFMAGVISALAKRPLLANSDGPTGPPLISSGYFSPIAT